MVKNRRTVGISRSHTNVKGYGVIMILGAIGGIALYHLYGKTIDTVYTKIPYLNKLPSYYAEEGYE